MIRLVFRKMLLLAVLLSVGGGCAVTSPVPPVATAHGYSVSFDAADRTLWLGPQALGDPRPNMTTLVAVVRDQQGHGVDGVAVEFVAEPSWVDYASIVSQHARTQAGIARAIFEPRLTGVVHVMAHVDGQTYTRRLSVVVRNFGNTGR